MKILGITGGSGSGKSTVTEVWRGLGARVLDCDGIYHQLLREDSLLVRELTEAFPEAASGGTLDRRALSEIVFGNRSELERLNGITHKAVMKRVLAELEAAREKGAEVVAVEALYLLESGLSDMCDAVVCVVAPAGKRAERIMERDALDHGRAWARLTAQADDEYFLRNCDIVIENAGTPEQLREKAQAVYRRITDEKN